MHNRPDPEAMEDYYTDCASLPDLLQPHRDPATALPGPHQPWRPVLVPEHARSMVDGLSPYV